MACDDVLGRDGAPIAWADAKLAAALSQLELALDGQPLPIDSPWLAAAFVQRHEDPEQALDAMERTASWRETSGAMEARRKISEDPQLRFLDFPFGQEDIMLDCRFEGQDGTIEEVFAANRIKDKGFSFMAIKGGQLILRFDNTYSWVKPKSIQYELAKLPEEAAPETGKVDEETEEADAAGAAADAGADDGTDPAKLAWKRKHKDRGCSWTAPRDACMPGTLIDPNSRKSQLIKEHAMDTIAVDLTRTSQEITFRPATGPPHCTGRSLNLLFRGVEDAEALEDPGEREARRLHWLLQTSQPSDAREVPTIRDPTHLPQDAVDHGQADCAEGAHGTEPMSDAADSCHPFAAGRWRAEAQRPVLVALAPLARRARVTFVSSRPPA
eukprot:g33352.t1